MRDEAAWPAFASFRRLNIQRGVAYHSSDRNATQFVNGEVDAPDDAASPIAILNPQARANSGVHFGSTEASRQRVVILEALATLADRYNVVSRSVAPYPLAESPLGCLLPAIAGSPREGMKGGETIATYKSAEHAVEQVKRFLQVPGERLGLARAGHEMVSTRYSKEAQWQRFEALVAAL